MDRALAVPSSGKSRDQVVVFSFGGLFIDKRVCAVLQAMGPTMQARTQQSRAFGAGHLSRYDGFCGPWESLEVLGVSLGFPGACSAVAGASLGVPGASSGVPGRAQGIPGIPGGSTDVLGSPGILFIKMIP